MVFEKLFIESKGQPIMYNGLEVKMIDRIPLLSNRVFLKIEFVSTNSKWKQGIVLQTKGKFEVNSNMISNKIVLWEHTAPKIVETSVISNDELLIVYNVWQTEDGTVHYWHNGGAMYVEEVDGIRIYHCNDGFADDDFDDIIFILEINNSSFGFHNTKIINMLRSKKLDKLN